MEPNLDPIGHAASRQIYVMWARGIVTLMVIVRVDWSVALTIVEQIGRKVTIVAWPQVWTTAARLPNAEKVLVIAIRMLNVKKDWLVALTTVAQVGLMATTVATLHSVTTLTVQLGIVVELIPNVDKD